MKLWKLTPIARPDDTRWQDFPIFAEVVVRAETAAMARAQAAPLESDGGDPPSGNESLSHGSRLADEKMYLCQEIDASEAEARGFSADGERGVVHSELHQRRERP